MINRARKQQIRVDRWRIEWDLGRCGDVTEALWMWCDCCRCVCNVICVPIISNSITAGDVKRSSVNSSGSDGSGSHSCCSLLTVDLKNFKTNWNEEVSLNRERWKTQAAKGVNTMFPARMSMLCIGMQNKTSSHRVVCSLELNDNTKLLR